MRYKRLKNVKGLCYVSFTAEEDILKAIEILQGMQVKNNLLCVRRVAEDPFPSINNNANKNLENLPLKTATELVTPLANLTYQEQLEHKFNLSKEMYASLQKHLFQAGLVGAYNMRVEDVLENVNFLAFKMFN